MKITVEVNGIAKEVVAIHVFTNGEWVKIGEA